MNAPSSSRPEESDLVPAENLSPESHPSSLVIRPLRETDVEPLRQLLADTTVFTSEEIAIAVELMRAVLDRPEQKDYIIRVYDDGEILGYYCVGPTPATDATFDLYWIATRVSMHGKGVGRILIAHAENLIRSLGGTLVVAETSSTPRYDRTRSFYLKAGYAELARIRDYYRSGDSLVVYGKYL